VPGTKFQITNGGADQPLWSRDGTRLFYQAGRKVIAVAVTGTAERPGFGRPETLFDLPVGAGRALNAEYDVAKDGRFLFNVPVDSQSTKAIVALHWRPDVR
jgi:hypothetical protein